MKIALLGSTGSIGEQTLDVVRSSGGKLEVQTLTAHSNWERLAAQARELRPDSVVIARKEFYPRLRDALSDTDVKVYAGPEALEQVVGLESVDVVVNALVGYAGLRPTVAALEAGKKVALANKESLVVAGDYVMRLTLERGAPILPIDSEHSAVLQCLVGEPNEASKLILTASGGPFLNTPLADLERVTPQQALRHPNWTMGAKITIDSATMLNKGFEVIEARWLFGIPEERIEVVVHPQSVVHSMVEFADGSIKAQLGRADMRIPIQYALYFPQRLAYPGERFSLGDCSRLDFLPVDEAKFPALELARECLRRGGLSGCVLNAANEVAVAAFLNGQILFTGIVKVIEQTLAQATHIANPSLEDYHRSNAEAREIAEKLIKK